MPADAAAPHPPWLQAIRSAGGDATPSHDALVDDLRRLRVNGLMRLRALELPALNQAARQWAGPGVVLPTDVERLLRAAVGRLGEEETGSAAQYLYGLVQGMIGRSPTDLRERAAREYGLSPETFRKKQERQLIARIADEVLLLPAAGKDTVAPDDGPARAPHPVLAHRPEGGSDLARDLERALAGTDPVSEQFDTARYGPYPMTCGENVVLVIVDVGKVEHLEAVDVVVSSENTYLEPARMYTSTLSGSLRRAAALRSSAGAVTHDVVAGELAAWVGVNGSAGRPFEPGVVVPTSSGQLLDQGVRRLYHAAVAAPRTGSHEYHVAGESIVRCIRRTMRLLATERNDFTPPLTSFSMPLFGAGYGRMDPAESFSWVWRALRAELARDGAWEVHFTALGRHEAVTVLQGLLTETN